MSNADFQERLRRLEAKAPAPQPVYGSPSGPAPAQAGKRNYILMFAGALVFVLGLTALRSANQGYETFKSRGEPGMILGLALFGLISVLLGSYMLGRSASRPPRMPQPRRKASKAAQWVSTSLGMSFGATAVLLLFLGTNAQQIDVVAARPFMKGAIAIALLLCLLSLLVGLAGIFVRGRALWRVPVYFLVSTVSTFVAIALFKIELHEWEPFTSAFQKIAY